MANGAARPRLRNSPEVGRLAAELLELIFGQDGVSPQGESLPAPAAATARELDVQRFCAASRGLQS